MGLDIKIERPPNFEAISKVFPIVLTQKGILFCWGTFIYNPDGVDIPQQLIKHEEVHSKQQEGKPDIWWDKYLQISHFRFDQELEAHREEYRVFYEGSRVRKERRVYLRNCARRLSGPLYGNCVGFETAKRLIKET